MRHQSLPGKGKASKSSRPAGPLAPSGLSSKQQKRDLKRAAKAAAGGTELGNKRLKAAESPSPQVSNMISAYKRPNVYPESYFSSLASAVRKPGFLTPSDAMYPAVMTRCYKGAFVEDGSAYSLDFHDRFDAALRGLENNTNFLKFDITQPGGLGTKIAKTYVSRCVVGQPGITYKYLGLRLFAYPWTAGEEGATPETVEIGRLNDEMVRHTSQLLADRCDSSNPYYGSCQYNLTLINR